ncbi:MAG: pyrroline-5-carboxylate reductase [Coriobacteriia bacterium]|nr:pyrroline-5-carboxylate reductase [Coriobacteriia bacterium]
MSFWEQEMFGEESERYDSRVLLVGAGQMGAPFLPVLFDSFESDTISVVDPNPEMRDKVNDTYPQLPLNSSLSQFEDNSFGPQDWIILAVKPTVIPEIVDEVNRIGSQTLILSIAVGVSAAQLEEWFPFARVIRLMPNLAMLFEEGTTLIAPGTRVTTEEVEAVAHVMEAGGAVLIIDEKNIDVATAISGSGPAYCALVIEALEKAGVAEGLDKELAHAIACSTIGGTARMLEYLDHEPRELADAVQSPGGTTECAVAVLEERGLEAMFRDAVRAAVERATELRGDTS